MMGILKWERIYFENKDDRRAEDGKHVHSMQIIPNDVIFLIGHPCGRHKQEKEQVQNTEPNDHIEKLY